MKPPPTFLVALHQGKRKRSYVFSDTDEAECLIEWALAQRCFAFADPRHDGPRDTYYWWEAVIQHAPRIKADIP